MVPKFRSRWMTMIRQKVADQSTSHRHLRTIEREMVLQVGFLGIGDRWIRLSLEHLHQG